MQHLEDCKQVHDHLRKMASSGGTASCLCHCSDRKAVHVQCFCMVCKGKAVNYRTQRTHLDSPAFCGTERAQEQVESELEVDSGETGPIRGKLRLLLKLLELGKYMLRVFTKLHFLQNTQSLLATRTKKNEKRSMS